MCRNYVDAALKRGFVELFMTFIKTNITSSFYSVPDSHNNVTVKLCDISLTRCHSLFLGVLMNIQYGIRGRFTVTDFNHNTYLIHK